MASAACFRSDRIGGYPHSDPQTPEQMAAQIRGDREKWGKVVKESGAKIE